MTELEYRIKHGGFTPKQILKGISRRHFNAALLGGLAATQLSRPLRATPGADFTLAVIPDPQNLAVACPASPAGSYYTGMMNWINTNKNLTLTTSPGGSFGANIKAVVGVGDCLNNPGGSETTNAVAGWTVLDSNSLAWVTPPGNHDYGSNAPATRSNLGSHFKTTGFFAASSRSAVYGAGISLGGGDMAYWVDSFDTTGANIAVKFVISGIKMLFISMDFFAGSSAWNWAYGVHQANLDCECYITTHGWLRMNGNQFARLDTNGPGSASYSMADSPYSNSTQQAWSGTGASGLTASVSTWNNLFGCFGGHDIDPASSGSPAWYWQRTPVSSSSARGQTVQQFFANSQEIDAGCSGSASLISGAGQLAQVFLLSRRPSLGLLEGRMLSTVTGDWIGPRPSGFPSGSAGWFTSEQLLFSIPFDGLSATLPSSQPSGVRASGVRA